MKTEDTTIGTIALGAVSEEMKHIYTLVLKAHIQLELVKFPDGASGTQLDAVGRECMWQSEDFDELLNMVKEWNDKHKINEAA